MTLTKTLQCSLLMAAVAAGQLAMFAGAAEANGPRNGSDRGAFARNGDRWSSGGPDLRRGNDRDFRPNQVPQRYSGYQRYDERRHDENPAKRNNGKAVATGVAIGLGVLLLGALLADKSRRN